jgi:hypothetical protein
MANNGEFEVDVRDIEYQRQAGKAWLTRIYQPEGTGPPSPCTLRFRPDTHFARFL